MTKKWLRKQINEENAYLVKESIKEKIKKVNEGTTRLSPKRLTRCIKFIGLLTLHYIILFQILYPHYTNSAVRQSRQGNPYKFTNITYDKSLIISDI